MTDDKQQAKDLERIITYFGKTTYRGEMTKFGIKTDDRRRHMYVIGKSGTGKTTLIENLIISDIQNGFGVAFVDPHGDSIEKILNSIPPERINDVIYFNPADVEYPIAFNILETVDPEHKHLVASGMMGVFKKIWPDVWSARMEYILNNTILSLLDYPGSTMLGINRMMSDKEFRKKVVNKIKDPIVKSFWVDEFAKYTDRLAVEATAAIQNKVGQFLSASVIRNIVGQVKSSFDMRKVMDGGKILLCNLSKGRIGEDNSNLLGGMVITKLQLAAMERVHSKEHTRKDFIMYVDEFQNFANPSFATILSEARKYHLSLVIAHQYIEQLDPTVKAAVFGNIGTLICMRVGSTDAEELVKEFSPYFTEEDLVNLPNFNFYIRLMIDGMASKPFSAIGLPPIKKDTDSEEKVIKVSRERYGNKRSVVEDKISRWIGQRDEEEEKPKTFVREGQGARISSPARQERRTPARQAASSTKSKTTTRAASEPEKKQVEYEVKCSRCGQMTTVKFKPDPSRPIFCKNCYQDLKKARTEQAKKEVISYPVEEVAQGEKEASLDVLKQPPPGAKKREAKKESGAQPKTGQDNNKGVKPGQVVRL